MSLTRNYHRRQAMALRILITPDGPDGLLVKPAEYLGPNFNLYVEATRRGGCHYDPQRKCQIAPFAALGDVVRALREAGFNVDTSIDLCLRADQQRRVAAEAKNDTLDALEADLATRGLRLYPFQRDGIRWLRGLRAALLGDDPGLGKTGQALCALPAGAPVAVVCPAAVKGVWAAEIARWRPDYAGRIRVLEGREKWSWPTPGEVVIGNYETLPATTTGPIFPGATKTGKVVHPRYGAPSPGTVAIFDEAHYAKTGKAARTAKARAVAAAVGRADGKVWALTGTPLTNRPPELWSVLMLNGLAKTAFGSWLDFTRLFGAAPTGFNGALEWPTDASKLDASIPDRLRRVMLKRRREEVLPDLPRKTRRSVVVGKTDFPKEALKLCDEAVAALAAEGVDLARCVDIVEMSKQGVPFALMSRARQALATAKLKYALDWVEASEEAEEPLVVFASHIAPLDVIGGREGWGKITGETSAEDRTNIVARFQAGDLRGLAVSIKAGGVGITLTRAHHAVFIDLAWTPADCSQAEDRLCRIGQKSAVTITRLVAPHALDARVNELLLQKQELIEATVDAAAVATVATDAPAEIDWAAMAAEGSQERPSDPALAPQERSSVAAADLPPQGRYALPTQDGALNALAFWIVHRPTDGRWAGWTFLSQQLGPERVRAGAVRPDGTVTQASVVRILMRIAADPRDAMARYGRELGACGRCGLPLTNDTSRALGLGPECAAKEA